ncbi:methylase involved in ubiquinone/menaquinone biosynthesis [Natrinema versiforme JCM 10478]|uniref:Methylase involved in ubiquinone/menaquinone biosynthesis n=1 Tax=Natrinema versiforme JCM 10478 TaxID=1227496 RepID=L9Y8J3_9EURY|nr:methylase involved in ubiquinone/menaquinone biosynthesis [Natrinema versiforme JCM 10478]
MYKRQTDGVVADLGSGTGFYADDVAPFVDTLYAVDVQSAMHDWYREKGVPDVVEFVTAEVSSLPFDDGQLDGAYSTMTHHEYASQTAADDAEPTPAAETDGALAELARVIRPGGRLVTVDWSADGESAAGPPLEERFDLATARARLEAVGFDIAFARDRPETFAVVATR